MKKIFLSLAFAFTLFTSTSTTQAISFAPNDPGIDIGTHLNDDLAVVTPQNRYEPSGVVWHNRLQSLFFVSDAGKITQTDSNGNIIHPSTFIGPGFDLEDITVVDEATNLVYLLQEFPQAIVEYDISSWTLTGQRWGLLGMPGNRSDGAEALTYNRATNEFYVGAQNNGDIYIYTIDLTRPGDVNFSRTINTGIDTDIAGLTYSDETRHIYALFDTANIIQEYDSHDVRVAQFDVSGVNQEGIAILPGCPEATAQIIIAEDEPSNLVDEARVMKYGSSYPLACIPSMTDNDRDGYMANVDCKDNDAAVNPGAIEILNDGKNNDCNSRTPDYVRTYTAQTLLHPFATEIRGDYHVFDNIGEYSYIQIPANFQKQWYTFELEARANSLDQLYSMGIYIPRIDLVHADMQIINRDVWKSYTFTVMIPASTPVDVRFISDVTGKRNIGGKREHHLRNVKVTRLEQIPNQFLIR
jgi:hypothetical protein